MICCGIIGAPAAGEIVRYRSARTVACAPALVLGMRSDGKLNLRVLRLRDEGGDFDVVGVPHDPSGTLPSSWHAMPI